jgi:hypothetical protein
MPKKSATKETTLQPQEAVAPVRVAKPKTMKAVPVMEVASKPRVSRVKSVMHSKAATAPGAITMVAVNTHDEIAKIAYGYWESRGYQPGGAEQDWLRAEREYLLQS